MTGKKIVVYFVIPAVVTLALIAGYFSGIGWVQQAVSPRIPQLGPSSGREFGLLENIQNLLLLVIIATTAGGARRKALRLEKAAMAFLTVFAVFILLEEIDYGRHYYEYFAGIPPHEAAQVRNIHNVGNLTNVIKGCLNVGMGLLFVVFPLAFAKSRSPALRYLAPDRWCILTMVAMVGCSRLAHALRDAGWDTQLTVNKNISEFREVSIYYIFMVYLYTLVFHRTYAANLSPVDKPNGAS